MRKSISWSIIFISCLLLSCAGPTSKAPTQPGTYPATAKAVQFVDGLTVTNAGIDFDDTHRCLGAYTSQTSNMTHDKTRQRTGYNLETTCATANEVHTHLFSNITYNQFGQRSGYQLTLSCNRTGKSYAITIDQIAYDKNWDVLSYTAEIDGKRYYYQR